MSRRPSLPGAAELFRATGSGAPSADPPPAREPERNGRLRAADAEIAPAPASIAASVAAPVAERTASVTPLAPSVSAPEPVTQLAPAPPPAARVAEPPPRPAEPASRAVPAYDDDAQSRPARTNGVRQTRRQRMRTVGERRPSGRERHEEKITVYCSAEELLDLETARLTLRGEHGLVVDRGRIVREAVAIILADLEAKGEDSILVRRFRDS
jgi:hypothetical protein